MLEFNGYAAPPAKAGARIRPMSERQGSPAPLGMVEVQSRLSSSSLAGRSRSCVDSRYADGWFDAVVAQPPDVQPPGLLAALVPSVGGVPEVGLDGSVVPAVDVGEVRLSHHDHHPHHTTPHQTPVVRCDGSVLARSG